MDLIERRLKTPGGDLTTRCAPRMAANADWLLKTIAGFQAGGQSLTEGGKIRFGWVVLTLRKEGGDWKICEPDFAADPVRDVREDVSLTLTIASAQGYVAKRAGAAPADCFYLDWVLAAKGCLGRPQLYLQREEPIAEGDSGWDVAALPPPGPDRPLSDPKERTDPKNYERIPAHALLTKRPGIVQALALPTGYFVVLNREEVIGVTDPRGKQVWGS